MKVFTVSYLTPTRAGWSLENFQISAPTARIAANIFSRSKQIKLASTKNGRYEGPRYSLAYVELSSPTKPCLEDFKDLPPLPLFPEVIYTPPEQAPKAQKPPEPDRTFYITEVNYQTGIAHYTQQAQNLPSLVYALGGPRFVPLTVSGAKRFDTEKGFMLIYENPPNYC